MGKSDPGSDSGSEILHKVIYSTKTLRKRSGKDGERCEKAAEKRANG